MRYEEKPQITEQEIREAMDFSTAQVKRNLPEFTTKFQKAYSENGFYAPTDNVDWTTGFWTGEIWLSYEDTGKDIYKKAGEIQIDSFLNRIENKIEVDHHDMGFLYSPSCVAGYKLTGNETGRKAAILAADQLIRRFHPVGNFIQAWGAMDAPENYRLIIDCLLNLPLLYWASEETGDPKYRDIAEKHIHTAVANVIREDHSTWHTFFFDMKTGAPDHGSHLSGIPRRFGVGERPGMGHLRDGARLQVHGKGRIHSEVPGCHGLFPGASAQGYGAVLGSGVHGRGRSAERFLLGVDRSMRNA